MSEYLNIPKIPSFTVDLTSLGTRSLTITPQDGPQQDFISCMAGMSGEKHREQDFPLIFYGGGQYAPQYMVTYI